MTSAKKRCTGEFGSANHFLKKKWDRFTLIMLQQGNQIRYQNIISEGSLTSRYCQLEVRGPQTVHCVCTMHAVAHLLQTLPRWTCPNHFSMLLDTWIFTMCNFSPWFLHAGNKVYASVGLRRSTVDYLHGPELHGAVWNFLKLEARLTGQEGHRLSYLLLLHISCTHSKGAHSGAETALEKKHPLCMSWAHNPPVLCLLVWQPIPASLPRLSTCDAVRL